MSGGSMNYLYSTIEQNLKFDLSTKERKAFYKLMQNVIQALHDIEWVDSGDYGEGDENKAILKCISKSQLMNTLLEEARAIKHDLSEMIKTLE